MDTTLTGHHLLFLRGQKEPTNRRSLMQPKPDHRLGPAYPPLASSE
ncbi:MAG: hypothetical protein QOF36_303 [Microbacteriaceae bacterium]|jgi:hypothetical protein|nr:hypothetical protein [Microbacteriaceae bacterium]